MDSQYQWEPTDFTFFGYNSPTWSSKKDDDEENVCTKRTRRVTITEITDDAEADWTFVNDDLTEDDFTADELYRLFEDITEDWKLKMEVIVGEGLKKLRKSAKDKRLMMKYLPGERDHGKRLGEAKLAIIKDLKLDFQKALGSTHRKLDRLSLEKSKQIEVVAPKKGDEGINRNKKQVINIDYLTGNKDKVDSKYGSLRTLIKDLDKMCNVLSSSPLTSVPIYKNTPEDSNNNNKLVPASQNLPLNRWLELQKYLDPTQNVEDFHSYLKNRDSILDVLEDFKIKHHLTNVKLHKKKANKIESTNAVNAQRRMLERKAQKKSQYQFKQYQKDGKEHFLIIKKKDKPDNEPVEEIFTDWKSNLETSFEQRRANLKARVRKLSHRALRKELLKKDDDNDKPFSYADIVKKNIKLSQLAAPVEDIFEAWRDYLQELDDLLNSRSTSPNDQSLQDLDTADIFQAWRHNLNHKDRLKNLEPEEQILSTSYVYQKELGACGQPTVKRAAGKVRNTIITLNALAGTKKVQKKRRRSRKYEKEIIFASWRHNLDDEQPIPNKTRPIEIEGLMPETIFNEWIHNLSVKPPHNKHHHYHSHKKQHKDAGEEANPKALKNKQRQQRRSRKKSFHKE